jgi:hypothetical protein
MIDGWNRAALTAAFFNLAGAMLAAASAMLIVARSIRPGGREKSRRPSGRSPANDGDIEGDPMPGGEDGAGNSS